MTMLTTAVEATAIRPFQVRTPDTELTELRRRITATRFPEKEPVTDFSQGVPLATTQKLARYWATEYDWRKVEARLNAVPNFITEIDGLGDCDRDVCAATGHRYGVGERTPSA